MAANIVALGAIAKLTAIVTPKALKQAVLARAPRGTEQLNLEAFKASMTTALKTRRSRRGHELSESGKMKISEGGGGIHLWNR